VTFTAEATGREVLLDVQHLAELGLGRVRQTRGTRHVFAGHPVQYGRIEYAGFACRTIERSRAYDSKPRTAPWYEVLHDLVEL
jgi:hypothetical protein